MRFVSGFLLLLGLSGVALARICPEGTARFPRWIPAWPGAALRCSRVEC